LTTTRFGGEGEFDGGRGREEDTTAVAKVEVGNGEDVERRTGRVGNIVKFQI